MFGAHYFGQEEPASTEITATTPTGGGGWSHRGKVVLPVKRKSGLPELPKLPKPPYYR